jgi:hypothetical protein
MFGRGLQRVHDAQGCRLSDKITKSYVVVPYSAGSSRELGDDHWGPGQGEVEIKRERSRWVEKGL